MQKKIGPQPQQGEPEGPWELIAAEGPGELEGQWQIFALRYMIHSRRRFRWHIVGEFGGDYIHPGPDPDTSPRLDSPQGLAGQVRTHDPPNRNSSRSSKTRRGILG